MKPSQLVNSTPDTSDREIAGLIKGAITDLEYDVSQRNSYIERRDQVIWGTDYVNGTGTGLFKGMKFPGDHDVTSYNWGPRVVHIHASQLFGRGINVTSTYDKEDDSLAQDDQDKQLMQLRNKKAKANADARNKAIRAMIKDNGGQSLFYDSATIGSAYGSTVLKEWFDNDLKKTQIVSIESVNNCYVGWADTNFREADYYAFVYQISPLKAAQEYGDKLPKKADGTLDISVSQYGQPFYAPDAQQSVDMLNKTVQVSSTQKPMVTVIEYTGRLNGYTPSGDKLVKCAPGDEKRFNALLVGDRIVQLISDESLMPDYYVIPNIRVPRRPWGQSDISESAISINQTYIQKMSDWLTMYNKFLFPKYAAIGFEQGTFPKWKQRQADVFGMEDTQDIKLVDSPLNNGYEMPKVLEELKSQYILEVGVGRVMFDDPSVSANSNQALMTTLKGVIDIAEAKQKNWDDALTTLFATALQKASKHIPALKDIVNDDSAWSLRIEWPSILKKEDQTYQMILQNQLNSGTISIDSYLEKAGMGDAAEELDRIRDNMSDPVTAAILGRALGEIAHQEINKSLGIPPWGYITPKVQLRGELAPQEVGNMAHNYDWDQGPYGPAIGPTGIDGAEAADKFDNSGFVNPDGSGNYQGPQPQAPTLTPGDNGPQAVSQPGSGAPAVSPAGAVAQVNQNRGR